jgi:hypothetical protein
MKSRKNVQIKRLFEDYINPEGSPDADSPDLGITLSTTSLDAQVKAYLQSFEENAVNITESFLHRLDIEHMIREGFKLLFEQEEEEFDLDMDVESETGSEIDSIVSDVESDVEKLTVGTVDPQIDIQSFAQNVQSLLGSVQSKLDFDNPIMNMAVKYIREQYDENMANELIDTLREMGYKIKVEKSKLSDETDDEGKG